MCFVNVLSIKDFLVEFTIVELYLEVALNLTVMKKYTIHFLIFTIITAILGFTGMEFIGDSFVRFACLLSVIGLLISCLDSVILSRKKRRLQKRAEKVEVEQSSFNGK